MKRLIIGCGAAAVLALFGCETEDTLYNQQGPASSVELDEPVLDERPVDDVPDRIGGGFGGGAQTGGEFEANGDNQEGLIIRGEEGLPLPQTEERMDPAPAEPVEPTEH